MKNRDLILLVVHAFLPRSVAGTEIHAYHLARHLSRHYRVHIVHGEQDRTQAQGSIVSGDYRGIPTSKFIQNYPYRALRDHADDSVDRSFRKLLKRLKPTLVHFHHLSTLSLGLPALCQEMGIKTAMTLHDYWMMCPSGGQLSAHPDAALCTQADAPRCAPCFANWRHQEGALENFALRLAQLNLGERLPSNWPFRVFQKLPAPVQTLVRRLNPPKTTQTTHQPVSTRIEHVQRAFSSLDAVLSPSKDLLQRFRQAGFSLPNGHHIANGVPDPWADPGEILAPSPPKKRDKQKPIRFLHIGTLVHHKGTDVLVEAAKHLDPEKHQMDIYGPTDMFPAYTAPLLEAAKRIPALNFLGALPMERVQTEMAQSHALVHGARWPENAPLTLLEAQAARLPIIAPNIGGIPEMVHDGKNGLLYTSGNAQDLAEKLLRFANDPALQLALSDGHTPPLTAAENAQIIRSLYASILGRALR